MWVWRKSLRSDIFCIRLGCVIVNTQHKPVDVWICQDLHRDELFTQFCCSGAENNIAVDSFVQSPCCEKQPRQIMTQICLWPMLEVNLCMCQCVCVQRYMVELPALLYTSVKETASFIELYFIWSKPSLSQWISLHLDLIFYSETKPHTCFINCVEVLPFGISLPVLTVQMAGLLPGWLCSCQPATVGVVPIPCDSKQPRRLFRARAPHAPYLDQAVGCHVTADVNTL